MLTHTYTSVNCLEQFLENKTLDMKGIDREIKPICFYLYINFIHTQNMTEITQTNIHPNDHLVIIIIMITRVLAKTSRIDKSCFCETPIFCMEMSKDLVNFIL